MKTYSDRLLAAAGVLVVVSMTVSPLLAGDFVSKGYEFKPNKVLEVGLDLPGGVRFETIEFKVEAAVDGDKRRGKPRAMVTISNFGKEAAKVGIALAVVDTEGKLLAAATGGTKAFPLRPDRKMTYNIAFDDVFARIGNASAFRIAIETAP